MRQGALALYNDLMPVELTEDELPLVIRALEQYAAFGITQKTAWFTGKTHEPETWPN